MSLLAPRRVRLLATAALALASSTACADRLTAPSSGERTAQMRVTANVTGTDISTLVVNVSAADIAPPLVFNLTVVNGSATGTLKMPPGTARTIDVKAYDAAGNVTSEGAKTINVVPGNNNPPISMPMVAKSGHVNITVQLGSVSLVMSGGTPSLNVAQTMQLSATITAANGDALTDGPEWATADPSIASVSTSGLVTGLRAGTTSIVATYAGVAAVRQVTVIGGQPFSVGYPSAAVQTFPPPAGAMYAMPVTTTSGAVIDALGYVGTADGGSIRMGLYSDVGGNPGQLLVGSAATLLGAGQRSVAVSPTFVPAGTYWIAYVTDGLGQLGFLNDGGGETLFVGVGSVGSPMPSTFVQQSFFTGITLAVFMSGKS